MLFDPWLKAYFDYSRKNPVVGEPVTFDASLSTKPCNTRTIICYTWNFDDSNTTTTTNPIIIHAFAAPRTYNVTLTLTYDDATTGTEWALVYVAKKPYLKVVPETINLGIRYKTFQVNVTINDLDANQRVVGVQFRLQYDDTLLEVVNVTEGSFMKDPRWNPYGTFFISFVEVGPIYGPGVLVGDLLLPNGTGYWDYFLNGSGVLATITFRAGYQERGLEKPPLTCNLTLEDTIVMDDELSGIPGDIQSGVYKMWPTHIGDFNYDGKVDMQDIERAARAFGEFPGRPRWDPVVDANNDGKVNMLDIGIIARGFGWRGRYDP